MALVMRSAGLSRIDTLRTRRRPVLSHSCTTSIFNSTCFHSASPRRLHTASRSVSLSRAAVLFCTAILAKVVLLQSLRLLPSRWRIARLLRSKELSSFASVPMLALRIRERELVFHCNSDEFLCNRLNHCRPALAKLRPADRGAALGARQLCRADSG